MGEHEFNKRSKTKELKPVSEIVTVPVPPIIDKETFEAVQKLLKARNPKVMPARVISGPTMLTGLIHCAKCGGAMTIRTGKGGRYRYYACSMKARQGRPPARAWPCRWRSWTIWSSITLRNSFSSPSGWKPFLPPLSTQGRTCRAPPRAYRRVEQARSRIGIAPQAPL
jgi:hypothetical protein